MQHPFLARVPDADTAYQLIGLLGSWFGGEWRVHEEAGELFVASDFLTGERFERARYYAIGFLAGKTRWEEDR